MALPLSFLKNCQKASPQHLGHHSKHDFISAIEKNIMYHLKKVLNLLQFSQVKEVKTSDSNHLYHRLTTCGNPHRKVGPSFYIELQQLFHTQTV